LFGKRTVHGRVHGVYTACIHGRVRVANTAVYTAHVHGRICIRPMYTACKPPVQAVYTARTRPYTAVYTVVSSVRGPYMAVTRPCTCREHGRVRGRYTGRVHAVYTAVYGPCAKQRCIGRVHVHMTVYTALYRQCSWSCARFVYTAV